MRVSILLLTVTAMLGWSAASSASAETAPDVRVLLVPVAHPGDKDPNADPCDPDLNTLSLDWTTDPYYHLEIWADDVPDVTSGIVAAYFDVHWDSSLGTALEPVHHDATFPMFLEGSIDSPLNQVTNFGGTNLQPQGLASYVRLGWIDFQALGPDVIDYSAQVGVGEVGVFGRSVGPLEIVGATVYTPEPQPMLACAALALAALRPWSRRFRRGCTARSC